ncbi:MAG: PIN domain-containing protein [Nanoarchaeota archaeon]|nr:PIN domain-containing protein [Nanoarchaeota archaeon]
MANVVLDTSFILTSVRNKLDFYEELINQGHSVLIPKEVIHEIERIKNSSKSLKVKDEANLALKLILSGNHKEISCPGKYVDKGIKNYLDEHKEFILASLDVLLKKSVRNRKIVIRNKKKLELQ